jgi:hypothetical protein
MKLHTDYDEFQKQLDQIAPIYPNSPMLFDDPKDWDMPKQLKAQSFVASLTIRAAA